MNIRFPEPLLNEPVETLGLSAEFCGVMEIFGFHTLADLLDHHTSDLLKLPGFNHHLLYEYIGFLEERRMGHYIDA